VKFAEYAKMYVALVGLVAAGVAGVPDIPVAWKLPLEIVIAVVGAFAVWKVENKSTPAGPSDFDFDPPAPNWASAGPAWDEPAVPPVKDDKDGGTLYDNVIPIRRREVPLYAAA